MEDFAHDTLRIGSTPDAGRSILQLVWTGRSRDRQPGKLLSPYLGSALAWAADRKYAVEMRFDELDFFNSATVMVLIQTIHQARAKGVALSVIYAEQIEWQKLSFGPMRVFEQPERFRVSAVDRGNPT